MSPSLFLSRARLKSGRGEALSAIAPVLVPADADQRVGHAHRIVWLLFQDILDATRDFLWRDEGDSKYLILSRRPPSNSLGLFELETKPFAPELSNGDRLCFSLRANPTTTTKRAGSKPTANGRLRGKRVDVVMDALFNRPGADRPAVRDQLAAEATATWLGAQGQRAGFEPMAPVEVESYTHIDIERRRGRSAGISILDLKGIIKITDPAAFLDKLSRGFGSAKAFGNGLMLIRRA